MKKIFILVSFFFLFSNICIAEPNNKNTKLALQVIKSSGINIYIKAFPDYIDAFTAQKTIYKNPEIALKITKIIKDNYNIAETESSLLNYILKNTDSKLLNKTINWYETPIGKKITEAKNLTAQPQSQVEINEYFTNIKKNPPSPKKIQAIQELIENGNLVDQSTTLMLETLSGLLNSINIMAPENKKIPEPEIQNVISITKTNMESILTKQVFLSSLFSYRDISAEEINQYTAYLSSPSGQEFSKIGQDAITFSLKKAFINIGKKVYEFTQS